MLPIYHKFHETTFGAEFRTYNSILQPLTYSPEVMIVGTFNPGTPHANFADFFYGRNFFWGALKNLFVHNKIEILSRRMPTNGVPRGELNPTLDEILELCKKLKLTFADLIDSVLHDGDPEYRILQNDNINYCGDQYNLIQDGKVKNIYGLAQLEQHRQINWNEQNIITYLSGASNIKTIYFTRRPTGVWADKWLNIVNHSLLADRNFVNIFTPSGQGEPVHLNMTRLVNHWLHNDSPKFGKLNKDWLLMNGVSLENF